MYSTSVNSRTRAGRSNAPPACRAHCTHDDSRRTIGYRLSPEIPNRARKSTSAALRLAQFENDYEPMTLMKCASITSALLAACAEVAAAWYALDNSARPNAKPAGWTAVSVLLTAVSSIADLFA